MLLKTNYVLACDQDKAAMADSKGCLLLTGANGALGRAVISQIVSKPEFSGYHGIYTVRDASSAKALDSVLRQTNHSYDILLLDLSLLRDVRIFSQQIKLRVQNGDIPPIRALILNAAYLELKTQTWTEDGFDMSFASSYLGHWLLTLMLLGSMDRDMGRIVVIGSSVHEQVTPCFSFSPFDVHRFA